LNPLRSVPPSPVPPAPTPPSPVQCDTITQWIGGIQAVAVVGFLFVGLTFIATVGKMNLTAAAHQNIRHMLCWRVGGREKMSILGTISIALGYSGILLYAAFQILDSETGQAYTSDRLECQTKSAKESSNNLSWSVFVLMYVACFLFFYSGVVLLSMWVFRNDPVEIGIFEKAKSIYDQRRKSLMMKTTVPDEEDAELEKQCCDKCLLCLYIGKQRFDAWFSYEVRFVFFFLFVVVRFKPPWFANDWN